jgi:hypothetical protein
MVENEFRRAVSVDSAPACRESEWCEKPAIVRLTAIGGVSHNESGLFCQGCGAHFARNVTPDPGSLQHDHE